MIRAHDLLTTTELAPYVQRAKYCAFDMDEDGIADVLNEISRELAYRAVKAYAERSRKELMELAAENKRLREQLGRKKKCAPSKVADVISLAAVKAARS
ncbi:MAG: hypothetical protein FWD73_15720 [Polyangiaceae bacterium]|nr:hypothetical protein [Polyangiaceae bacterium]